MPRVKCPVLIIHEELDNLITTQDTMELAKASANRNDVLWEVPGVEHVQAYKARPVEYIDKMADFFQTAFAGRVLARITN